MPVHKKEDHIKSEEKPVEIKTEEIKVEAVETPDLAIEIAEESSQAPSATDPLKDFKEKMIEEEMYPSDLPQKKNYMWPILFIFIVAIVLFIGIFIYKQGLFKGGEKVNVVSINATTTVTPAPTKAVDLSEYEIEIQNGSEVDGEASRQKANLESEGFTISSIGNADSSDYTDTIVKAKAEVSKEFIVKLKDVLGASFTVGDTEVLSEDSSSSVVVILGIQK